MDADLLPEPFTRDGELLIPLTPVSTPLPRNLLQGGHRPGRVLTSNSERPWNWFGFSVEGSFRFVRGEMLSAEPLDMLFTLEEEKALALIAQTAHLLDQAKMHEPFALFELYLIQSSGLLRLPEQLAEVTRHGLGEEELFILQRQWIRPDLRAKEALLYELTALLYAVLTGESPLARAEARQDGYRPAPVGLLRPDLPPETAAWIDERLAPEPRFDDSPESWSRALSEHLELSRIPDPPDRSRELEEFRRRQRKRAGKKESRRRNRIRNRVLAAAAAVVLAVAFSFLRQALAPVSTEGMSPEELISYYYRSHNELDITAVGEALDSGTSSSFDRIMTYMHVSSAVRGAYEQDSGFIPAKEWIEEGKPEVAFGTTVFGITDLEITRIDEDTYAADYLLHLPLSPDEREQAGAPVREVEVTEELDLRRKGDRWVIEEIRQTRYE